MTLTPALAQTEALLFASGAPLPLSALAELLSLSRGEARTLCQELAALYEAEGRGIRLVFLEDRAQLISAPQHSLLLQQAFAQKSPEKLSPAALEVLAIVAYYQPVTRAYVDQLRGVDSAHSLRLLLERELIAESGRLDVPGRPYLYRTTDAFLRVFGLSSTEQLPPLPEPLIPPEEAADAPSLPSETSPPKEVSP